MEKRRFYTDGSCRIVIGVCLLLLVIVSVVVGFSVGRQSSLPKATTGDHEKDGKDSKKRIKQIVDGIQAKNIENNLRYLTEKPHPAGQSVCSEEQVEYLVKTWKEQGLENVNTHKYNILLSYPNKPGQVQFHVLNSTTNTTETVSTLVIENEKVVDESEKSDQVLYPFNAFSPKAKVTGEMVYLNYGRTKDFEKAKDLGVNVAGNICLMKYGWGARSSKVNRATQYGCIGCIIYSDLIDSTVPGQEYPKGWMMNEDAIQRGTINQLPGDALSVGYPAKDGYWRLPLDKEDQLPKIPSQPISFAQARQIFGHMKGDHTLVPADWIGRFDKSVYKMQSGKGVTFTLDVDTRKETRETVSVCGTIYGREEKDRYILVGNHRDSWTFGAADPSSGTSCMMEMVRSMGSVKKSTGWRPRRSIMFCSWDAEEPGTLGSTEWADDHHQFIMNHVVTYLNVDMAVEGNFTVRLKALEHIEDSVFDAAKELEAPDTPGKSLYTDWLEKSALLENKPKVEKPKIFTPSAGSDYKCFWWTYGTTIVDYRYLFSKVDYPFLETNGHYHTRYESFGWMSKYVDPGFKYHRTLAQLWTQHALSMAESQLIPLDLVKYVTQVQRWMVKFGRDYEKYLKKAGITLDFIKSRLSVLLEEANRFTKHVKLNFLKLKELEKRSVNDKIMNFERNFLITGLTSNAAKRHVIWPSASKAVKSGNKFPALQEAIYDAHNNITRDWDQVNKQLTLITWCIDTATKSLKV